jgi:hypothetical protein
MWSSVKRFCLFKDEIARQLTDSGAKILFGLASMSGVLKSAVEQTKKVIKIVYITENSSEAIPSEGIRFSDLVDSKKVDLSALKESDRDCLETVMLPYSRCEKLFFLHFDFSRLLNSSFLVERRVLVKESCCRI